MSFTDLPATLITADAAGRATMLRIYGRLYMADAVGRHALRILHDLVQLIGAIGFTWEHGLHFYARRAHLDAQHRVNSWLNPTCRSSTRPSRLPRNRLGRVVAELMRFGLVRVQGVAVARHPLDLGDKRFNHVEDFWSEVDRRSREHGSELRGPLLQVFAHELVTPAEVGTTRRPISVGSI